MPPTVSNALARAQLPLSSVSIVVQPLDAIARTLSVNADTPRNPASVAKLVTTFVALDQLGPAYTWTTEALSDGVMAEALSTGVLKGALYLRSNGDPKFNHERLWLLLRELRDAGIREIAGDLVLDRSAFAAQSASPGDFDGRPLRPYNALPDALFFHYNSVTLRLRPGEQSVAVGMQPQPDTLRIDNRLRLNQARECGDWRERLEATPLISDGVTRLVLSGDYPRVCGEREWHIQALRPNELLGGTFRRLWQELGGGFTGQVREGTVPAAATVIAVSPAPTCGEVVRDINKFSNNVMARQLFLTLGRESLLRNGNPAAAREADAEAAIAGWLRERRLDLPHLQLINGSGLAREGRVTAGGLANLLQHAWRSPVMPEFIASLPITAVDGTLKKRGQGSAAAGRAHLKTGFLEGVRAIAGYVLDAQGRRWLVVMLVNHAQAGAAREAMDALVDWVATGAGTATGER
ncbi:MAG: D-alanyl-D-alanine carboxypeptidase/D-alanyl-D-alanine-endopeptidase [Rhodocyclaceae bacterium]|nr:D-alanyl-D-alanine carboxypeptidase/D-alanyl-D-alanine-endopeptidase [Rhodocyclaceae bacterium]